MASRRSKGGGKRRPSKGRGEGTPKPEFPGPIAPEEPLPVPDESKFELPSLPLDGTTVRKRRRAKEDDNAKELEEEEQFSVDDIKQLTAAYRAGTEDKQKLIDKIEVDPDYMFKGGSPEGDYEMTAAIIGTGRPNKDGVYVLPYLQSSHFILLLIILLGTFVYYPGFPLTEGDDSLRLILKKALAVVFTVNFALACYSYTEARKRKQPPLFWFLKVALFGNIALQELRTNAPLDSNVQQKSRSQRRKKRQ